MGQNRRLVQDEQPRPPGQRQGQRELGPLAAEHGGGAAGRDGQPDAHVH
jgi:hypothetical protein